MKSNSTKAGGKSQPKSRLKRVHDCRVFVERSTGELVLVDKKNPREHYRIGTMTRERA